jgi:hypothetical protein
MPPYILMVHTRTASLNQKAVVTQRYLKLFFIKLACIIHLNALWFSMMGKVSRLSVLH